MYDGFHATFASAGAAEEFTGDRIWCKGVFTNGALLAIISKPPFSGRERMIADVN
ncbi:MAG: hypothetical protein DFNUSKGM_001962 [Candidatus Fervidibacter sacchari]